MITIYWAKVMFPAISEIRDIHTHKVMPTLVEVKILLSCYTCWIIIHLKNLYRLEENDIVELVIIAATKTALCQPKT